MSISGRTLSCSDPPVYERPVCILGCVAVWLPSKSVVTVCACSGAPLTILQQVSRGVAMAGFADIGDGKLCQGRLVSGMKKLKEIEGRVI